MASTTAAPLEPLTAWSNAVAVLSQLPSDVSARRVPYRGDNNGNYRQIPPTSIDPAQNPIPMPLKSTAITDLRRTRPTG
jgi:hypothetical protein